MHAVAHPHDLHRRHVAHVDFPGRVAAGGLEAQHLRPAPDDQVIADPGAPGRLVGHGFARRQWLNFAGLEDVEGAVGGIGHHAIGPGKFRRRQHQRFDIRDDVPIGPGRLECRGIGAGFSGARRDHEIRKGFGRDGDSVSADGFKGRGNQRSGVQDGAIAQFERTLKLGIAGRGDSRQGGGGGFHVAERALVPGAVRGTAANAR